MKHKVSELEGDWLDAAVAKAEGLEVAHVDDVMGCHLLNPHPKHGTTLFSPTSWEHGGPIIDREGIDTSPLFNMRSKLRAPGWAASIYRSIDGVNEGGCAIASAAGPTLLIAAMRAYVASKFGDEVELP